MPFIYFIITQIITILAFSDHKNRLKEEMLSSAKELVVEKVYTYGVNPVSAVYIGANEQLARVHPAVLVLGSAAGTCLAIKLARLYRRSEQPISKRHKLIE